ncbi:MAG: 50S ribosomal protein L2 [Candidatus Bathyarchaeota archaeon]|nr:50S ribosomal protein L2 [Candidatus Bathyarchaeota archaeon]
MGKRIRVQRRGRGTSVFRASSHKRVAPVQYPSYSVKQQEGVINGEVKKILHDPGRGSPMIEVKLENGDTYYSVVPEGVYEGQPTQVGSEAAVDIGNVLPIGKVPEGTMVCNIELSPGDGGKMVRASGAYATVVSHSVNGTIVKLPSKRTRYINDLCRVTVGVISGAGRIEKPFLKAGNKFHLMKAKGHLYPRTSARAMIAACHPFGSGRKGGRKCTTVSRNAPPGRKVGLIAARSPGNRVKRRRV